MIRTNKHLQFIAIAILGVFSGSGCSSEPLNDAFGTSNDGITGAAIDDDGKSVLPNWATAEERVIEEAASPVAPPRGGSAPAGDFRIPAQYEPVHAVVMTWAGYAATLKGISVAAAAAGAEVWMVGGPASIAGVPASQYKALPFGYDSIWMRDYGPVGINEATNTLGIVDTTYRHYAVRREDNAVSCRIAHQINAECHPTNLILDGGNYMTDGRGNAFLTKRVYDWNKTLSTEAVDELLRTHLGARNIYAVDYAKDGSGEPADGTGHLDMFAKIIADCHVVVARTESEPFKTVTEKAADFFTNLSCGDGKYKVDRVKGWALGRTWYTYSNALMVNKSIIIPHYTGRDAENTEAIEQYRRLLPGYQVTGVNTEELIRLGGSVHCITKDIPKLRK